MHARRPASARSLAAVAFTSALLTLAPGAPSAQDRPAVRLRPIDQATVRLVSVQGARRVRDQVLPIIAHGSGAFVDPGGWIVTAAHVTERSIWLTVLLPGEDIGRPAKIVYQSPAHDLAIVRITGPVPAALTLQPDGMVELGQAVQISGYPLDPRERFPSATAGLISRPLNDGRIELSTSVNPGNSGGPVTVDGTRLIGVVSAGANLKGGAQGFAIIEPTEALIKPLRTAMDEAASDPETAPPEAHPISDIALEHARVRSRPAVAPRLARLLAHDDGSYERAELLAPEGDELLRSLRRARLDHGVSSAEIDDLAERVDEWNRKARTWDPQIGPAAPRPPDARPPDAGAAPRATPTDAALPPSESAFGFGAGLVIDDHPDAEGSGFMARIAVARIAPLSRPRLVRVAGVIGLELGFGTWRDALLTAAFVTPGLRVIVGPETTAAFIEGLYLAGYIAAEERGHFTYVGYRATAGVEIDRWTLGLAWQESARDADSTLRTVQLTASWEF